MRINKTITLIVLVLGVSLIFSRCEEDELIWMTYVETQCADPWDQFNETSTKDQVIAYLNENEVEVYGFELVHYSDGPFCLACTCPSGNNIKVQVDRTDREYLISLGFTE